MSEPGTDDRVIETLAILAAARALDRAGLIDYAWTLAGGSKLMLDNFGTSRMDSLVAEMAARASRPEQGRIPAQFKGRLTPSKTQEKTPFKRPSGKPIRRD